MNIPRGGDIKCLYLWTNNISKVYLWSEKIWPTSRVDTYYYDFTQSTSWWDLYCVASTTCWLYFCCYSARAQKKIDTTIPRNEVCRTRISANFSWELTYWIQPYQGKYTCPCSLPQCWFFWGRWSICSLYWFWNEYSEPALCGCGITSIGVDFPNRRMYGRYCNGRCTYRCARCMNCFLNSSPQYFYTAKVGYSCSCLYSLQLEVGYDENSKPR